MLVSIKNLHIDYGQNTVSFTLVSKAPIDRETRGKIQASAGYIPQGYGQYDRIAMLNKDGEHVYKWSCGASCE